MAMRYDNWKIVFMEQRCQGTLQVWAEPFARCGCPRSSTCAPIRLSAPTRTPTSSTTNGWRIARSCRPCADGVGEFLKTFKDFPPRQKPASFSVDQAIEKTQQTHNALAKAAGGGS